MKFLLKKGTQFAGTWGSRLEHILSCGAAFKDATVLDVGCNMGIVGYEVCKQGPAFYHGVEKLYLHSFVAEAIFLGVDTESRIDRFNVASSRKRSEKLKQKYDIVLYLAVHQHIRRIHGNRKALELAEDLFERCALDLVFRGPDIDSLKGIASKRGFSLKAEFPSGSHHPVCLFRRSRP